MLKITEPKKVLCIHDLSGVGRCSLAVILPVLSVMGIQPVALPNAEHRQDDRQTAASHTGKVMDAENFFRFRYLQQKRNLLRRICLFP